MMMKSSTSLSTKAASLEVKTVGESGEIEGYANVFGVVDSYNEIVEPGAFVGSLAEGRRKGRKVRMLWQHNPDQPIGVWDDLAEDSKGLYVKGRILLTVPEGAKAHSLAKEGAVDGLSIGYRTIETSPHDDKQGVMRLLKLDLREVSVVTFPANDRSRIDVVKSQIAGGYLPSVREFEQILRDAGFSKSLAAAIAGKATPHLRGEPEAKAIDPAAFLKALIAPNAS